MLQKRLVQTIGFLTILLSGVDAAPEGYGEQRPIIGQYEPYNNQRGPVPPFPGDSKEPIPPKTKGPPAADDELLQNLAAAEWAISAFYGDAVRMFNETSFTALGFPNTTYDRIQEIRDNEVGHVELMIQSISDNSVKPGPCKYNFNFSNPFEFLVRQVLIEASGPAFLPGLVAKAQDPQIQGLLTSLSQVEIRHGTWATIDNFHSNPFSGPADTFYPYPLQIVSQVSLNIIPGSCPKDNPPFPNPPQRPAIMSYNMKTSQGKPGQKTELTFPVPQGQPKFESGREYYAVFSHAFSNITVPFDVKTRTTTIPDRFDKGKGVIIAVISDQPGAPTEDSVLAGPLLMLQNPDLSAIMAMGS